MKKRVSFALILVLIVILVACTAGVMTACNNETKLNAQQQKIEKAFKGVAKSLTNQKAYTGATQRDGFFSLFAPTLVADAEETTGTANKTNVDLLIDLCDENKTVAEPEFKYDEPPMIQFQYIKALYEKVGASYELGKVYKDRVTGKADFDFATGKAGKTQDYVADVSIDIDIDSSDIIRVHLGLVIVYTAGTETHEQRFYAELTLDYDMNKSEPNYSLTMRYVDDCSRFEDERERTNTYEYDYVNVVEGKIKEWAKAYYISPTKMVKDDAHRTFDAYADAAKYGGKAQAFKNGKVYFTNHTDAHDGMVNVSLRRTLCATLYDDFGLNATEIKSDEYLAKEGTANANIKSTFDDFNKIAKTDVIAAFAISGVDDDYDAHPVSGGESGGRQLNDWNEDKIVRLFGYGIPAPKSERGVVNGYEQQNNAFIFTLADFTAQEFARWYEETLTEYNFVVSADAVSPQFTDVCVSVKEDTTYIIAYSESPNALMFAKSTAGSGTGKEGQGGQEGGDKDPTGGDKDPQGGDKDPSGGQGQGQGGEEQPQRVWVHFHIYDYEGKELVPVSEYPVEYTVGDGIDLQSMFPDKEVYLDPAFNTLAPATVQVGADATDFFVKPQGEAHPEYLDYTVIDVYADGTTETYITMQKGYGTTVDFCNMDYVLFEDAACTQLIDPNYTTTITDNITVYRRDAKQPKRIFLPTTFYINDVDVTNVATKASYDFIEVRRGKLFWSDTQFGVNPFIGGTYYYDGAFTERIFDGETYVYFDEEDNTRTHVYAYLIDKMYAVVPFTMNGEFLFNELFYRNDSTETLIYSAEDYGYSIDFADVTKADVNGVEVTKYTRLPVLETRFVYEGAVVGKTKNYIPAGTWIEYEEGNNVYLDADCTEPFVFQGEFTSSRVVYSKLY